MSSESSFKDVFESFRSGNLTARDELFARIRARLRRELMRQAGGFASDVAQDAMLKIEHHLKVAADERQSGDFKGETPSELVAWCRTIARNEANRRGRRQGQEDDRRSQTSVSGVPYGGSEPDRAELEEELERLNQALSRLPEQHRRVIESRCINEVSYEELAKELGTSDRSFSKAYARLRVSRAMDALKEEYFRGDAPTRGGEDAQLDLPEETLVRMMQGLAAGSRPSEDRPAVGHALSDRQLAGLSRLGFRPDSVLGEGAFATVWSAEQSRLGRRVALKILRGPGEDQAAFEMFEREAQLLARTSETPHPHLVTLWQFLDEVPCLVLELVPGGLTLAELVHREGPVAVEDAIEYASCIGSALAHLHDHDVLHRDVKPENILFDPRTGRVKLTDLGLAQRLGQSGGLSGTPRWMSPEVVAGGPLTGAVDVFSLAATTIWMISESVAVQPWAAGIPQPIPQLPRSVEETLRAALARDPADRPTAAEFSEALARERSPSAMKVVSAELSAGVARQEVDGRVTELSTERRVSDDLQLRKALQRPISCRVNTGDRLLLSVCSGAPGYLIVVNVGPTGEPVLLYPHRRTEVAGRIEDHRPVALSPVTVAPPAGVESVLIVWSRQHLVHDIHQWARLVARRSLRRDEPDLRNLVPQSDDPLTTATDELRAILLQIDHGETR